MNNQDIKNSLADVFDCFANQCDVVADIFELLSKAGVERTKEWSLLINRWDKTMKKSTKTLDVLSNYITNIKVVSWLS